MNQEHTHAHSAAPLWYNENPTVGHKLPAEVAHKLSLYDKSKHKGKAGAFCLGCNELFLLEYMTWRTRFMAVGYYCRQCE